MRWITALILAASTVATQAPPLEVQVRRAGATLEVQVSLGEELPQPMLDALPSGAQVSVQYEVQVRGRRAIIWDSRIWKGTATASVVFDPLTGRYTCEEALNNVIVSSKETASPQIAREWLRQPPAFRVVLPKTKKRLILRARAVYSVGTDWTVLPSVKATDWVVIHVSGD
ncbi:MAG: DUF4390 domain-containing protein [Acidobacteria bacterium]|nr:DUF4390 domain-containing protein [Acidobacteriota bacterium]